MAMSTRTRTRTINRPSCHVFLSFFLAFAFLFCFPASSSRHRVQLFPVEDDRSDQPDPSVQNQLEGDGRRPLRTAERDLQHLEGRHLHRPALDRGLLLVLGLQTEQEEPGSSSLKSKNPRSYLTRTSYFIKAPTPMNG